MHFANCVTRAIVLFTTLTENLRLCSSAEAGIALNFRKKWKIPASTISLI